MYIKLVLGDLRIKEENEIIKLKIKKMKNLNYIASIVATAFLCISTTIFLYQFNYFKLILLFIITVIAICLAIGVVFFIISLLKKAEKMGAKKERNRPVNPDKILLNKSVIYKITYHEK